MNKNKFIRYLRAAADELSPLIDNSLPHARIWNGVEYAESNETKKADPDACKWWAILTTMADLLERQGAPLSGKQIEYLKEILFGGMGSLNDLGFDAKQLPVASANINERLDQRREDLYAAFIADLKN